MIPILDLWMPILAASVLVFLASWLMHMFLKYHNKDWRALPKEAEALAAMRSWGLTPGLYHFPHCATPSEMMAPAMQEKLKQGPVGTMTVIPSGPMAMGKYLTAWFLFTVLVGVLVAYLAGRTLAPGAHYLAVFRVCGTAALLAYGIGGLTDSIWKGVPWSATIKQTVDGLIYALLTAGAFGWLWPR